MDLKNLQFPHCNRELYRVAQEKPARRLVDLRPRWSTRRRAGFLCATLY